MKEIERRVNEYFLKEKYYTKCEFLYIEKDICVSFSMMRAFNAIVRLNNYKLEELIIIICNEDIAITEIPLTKEYDESIYSEIK